MKAQRIPGGFSLLISHVDLWFAASIVVALLLAWLVTL